MLVAYPVLNMLRLTIELGLKSVLCICHKGRHVTATLNGYAATVTRKFTGFPMQQRPIEGPER
jgi:hypothetical protein